MLLSISAALEDAAEADWRRRDPCRGKVRVSGRSKFTGPGMGRRLSGGMAPAWAAKSTFSVAKGMACSRARGGVQLRAFNCVHGSIRAADCWRIIPSFSQAAGTPSCHVSFNVSQRAPSAAANSAISTACLAWRSERRASYLVSQTAASALWPVSSTSRLRWRMISFLRTSRGTCS